MGLKRILIDFWFSIVVGIDHGWTCVSLSRVLLFLTGIQLITMPFTQYLWTWDHFLHGGRDFETGLLMIVLFLCFALVRAQGSQKDQESLLPFGPLRSSVIRRREQRCLLCRALLAPGQETRTSLPDCSLPLLI